MEFVDSNIVVYAYDESHPDKQARAIELIERLARSREGVVSVQVLQEFFVNVTRKIERPLPVPDARRGLRALGRWPVHSPLAGDVITATVLAEENRISFWDAMIVRSAAEMHCETLWSEGVSDGQTIAGVRIVNPFA